MQTQRTPKSTSPTAAIQAFLRWRYPSTQTMKVPLHQFLAREQKRAQVEILAWAAYLKKIRKVERERTFSLIHGLVQFINYLHEKGRAPWSLKTPRV